MVSFLLYFTRSEAVGAKRWGLDTVRRGKSG